MANIRYAQDPPCCPCLDKANEAVWTAPPSVAQKFKYNYKPKKKIPPDDYEARKYWMDAYKACIEDCKTGGVQKCVKGCKRKLSDYINKDDPHLTPGTLRSRCSPPEEQEPPTKDPGNLVISVIDEDTKPVENADVEIVGPIRKTKLLAEDGTLRIDGLKPGQYRVRASKRGYSNGASTATVRAGQTTDVIIELSRKLGTLTVEVKNICNRANSILIPNSHVGISIVKDSSDFFYDEQDTPAGTATFTKLPTGVYRVWMSRPWRYPPRTHLDKEGPKWKVEAGETKKAALLFEPASLNVNVLSGNQPLSGATVRLTGGQLVNLTNFGYLEVQTSTDGKAKFENMKPNEKYKLQVWKKGHNAWEKSYDLGPCGRNEVTVHCDAQSNSSLHVTVKDWDEKGVSGAKVTATPLWLTLPPERRAQEAEPWVQTRYNQTDQNGVCIFAKKPTEGVDSSLASMAKFVITAKGFIKHRVYKNEDETVSIEHPSDQKTVHLTNGSETYTARTDKEVLHIFKPKERKMEIWIDSAWWVAIEVWIGFGMGVTLTFGIRDLETQAVARYKGKFDIKGIKASIDVIDLLKGAFSGEGAKTTGPGVPVPFSVKGFINDKVVNETSFVSMATLAFAKAEAGELSLLNRFTLNIGDPRVAIGKLETGPVSFIGVPGVGLKFGAGSSFAPLQRLEK